MKYILSFFLFAAIVWADTQHSFTININRSGSYGRGGTTWAAVRDAATSLTGNNDTTSTDTFKVAAWTDTTETDSFYVIRGRIFSDTLNGETVTGGPFGSYYDSIAVDAGNSARLDSIKLAAYIQNCTDFGGCSGYLYSYVFDTCATSNNYSPNTWSSTTYFNDYLTRDASFNSSALFDSVLIDTTLCGVGDSLLVDWTIRNRVLLDEIECMFNTGSLASAIRIDIVTCYDKDNVSPSVHGLYQLKAGIRKHTHTVASTQMSLTVYWTEVLPVSGDVAVGMRSAFGNAMRTGWRTLWR